MGCGFYFSDDYEKCNILIDEYQYLLDLEENTKIPFKKLEKHNQTKEELKLKIKDLLEEINEKAIGIGEIDKLQRLNEKYQDLLTEESKIRNYS